MPDPTTVVAVTSRDLWLILLGASAAFMMLGCLLAGIAWRRDRAAALAELDAEVLADLRRQLQATRNTTDGVDADEDAHFATLERIRAEIDGVPTGGAA